MFHGGSNLLTSGCDENGHLWLQTGISGFAEEHSCFAEIFERRISATAYHRM